MSGYRHTLGVLGFLLEPRDPTVPVNAQDAKCRRLFDRHFNTTHGHVRTSALVLRDQGPVVHLENVVTEESTSTNSGAAAVMMSTFW